MNNLDMFAMTVGGAALREGQLKSLPVENPTTEELLPSVPHAGTADVRHAVSVAERAWPEWEASGWWERAASLRALAGKVRAHAQELAELDVVSCGLPINAALRDVENGCRTIEYFAGLAGEITGTSYPPSLRGTATVVREPFGVVGRLLAFNHPAAFALSKCAAPLSAGNALLIKPSEHSPYSAMRIGEIAKDVLPPGVLNVITGLGGTTGAALVKDPGVRRIAVTGGLGTGRAVMEAAASGIKDVTLELGGKNPLVALPDSDPEVVAEAVVKGMNLTRSQGQSCGSTSRVFLHDSLHDAVVERVVHQIAQIRVGDPLSPDTEMGPLAFRGHYERVRDYILRGIEDGATLAFGGLEAPDHPSGFFVLPTLFINTRPAMAIRREEIFGPVISIAGWHGMDELVAELNSLGGGLTASIWSNDLAAVQRLVGSLRVGLIWVNAVADRDINVPWGGVGTSGIGLEYGLPELKSFTVPKSIFFGNSPR